MIGLMRVEEMEELLRGSQCFAVLGIKPSSRRHLAAYWIPEYMVESGYEIIPVPTRYPDVSEILGRPVVRALKGAPDLGAAFINVFVRPEAIEPWLPSLKETSLPLWFQSGCLSSEAAQELTAAGVQLAHDCVGCRHAAMVGSASHSTPVVLGP